MNRAAAKRGLKRMFLHATALALAHPATGTRLELSAPLSDDLQRFLDALSLCEADHAAPL